MSCYSKCYIRGLVSLTKLESDDYLFPLEDELCIKIKENILLSIHIFDDRLSTYEVT